VTCLFSWLETENGKHIGEDEVFGAIEGHTPDSGYDE
jgi:hypothetical protein